jgi:hypothetical protein
VKRLIPFAFVALLVGCPGWGAKTIASDVVTAAQFVCVEASALSDAKEVALACQIVDEVAKLTPEIVAFIEKLIGQRETLKAAGYHYDKPAAKWVR